MRVRYGSPFKPIIPPFVGRCRRESLRTADTWGEILAEGLTNMKHIYVGTTSRFQ
jgi:hypothetical protein